VKEYSDSDTAVESIQRYSAVLAGGKFLSALPDLLVSPLYPSQLHKD
jgi:hypothetical protein